MGSNMMEQLLQQAESKKVRKGDIVTGRVILIEDDKCYLDINAQAEAILPLDRFTKDESVRSLKDVLKRGEELQVRIINVKEDEEGVEIKADHLSLANQQSFLELDAKFKAEEPISVRIDSAIKPKKEGELSPGFNTYYNDSVRCFLPRSQALPTRKKGDVLKVDIIEIKNNAPIVSEKRFIEEEKAKALAAILAKFNKGDIIEATVRRLIPSAAFLDLGGVDAILRISDIAHEFVKDINEVLSIGQTLEVKVIDKKNNKISVSRKALLPTDFNLFIKDNKVGDVLKGKVQNKSTFGMFVELANNVRGLLHRSEYSWNPNSNLDRHYAVGDEVEVKIINIDENNEKISLSVRLLEDNPWTRIEAKKGDNVGVTISEIFDKGLLVDYMGVHGFIPNSQVLIKDRNKKNEDLYAVGDEIKAKIIEFDPKRLKLVLSIRRLVEDAERDNYNKFLQDQEDDFSNTIS